MYVADIVPDSSAEACGRIQRDDILHSIGNMEIVPGHTLEEVSLHKTCAHTFEVNDDMICGCLRWHALTVETA